MRYNGVIAAWADDQRAATRVLNGDGTSTGSGDWVQVARLGNPLVNEVVIAVQDKDLFNATEVTATSDYTFLPYVTDPLLIQYMNAILGVPIPSDADCDRGIGHRRSGGSRPGLPHRDAELGTEPNGFVLGGAIPGDRAARRSRAFEALRINLAVTASSDGRTAAWSVTTCVDTALSAEAGLLCASGERARRRDGVDSSGLTYLDSFPFLGDPWIGDDHPVMNLR